MPKIKVNGAELEVPAGKLLPALVGAGLKVPFYCWHEALEPAGNCRMCLVKVGNSRKLEVSCMWDVTEGLEVWTEGPDVKAGREAVLEYMLINHPLDCPICDKAGECMLQDHTYAYRHGVSRFQEDKVVKGTWDLGPDVRIWGNRCIACTRCVRFCEDVAGTGELSIVNRGDHSVADVHPEIPLANPMSLCTVDICPVGALIDKNFLYQARVWFSERKDSVCGRCSRGCNVVGTVYQGEVKRLQPRHNAEVNGHWMCDEGRLDIKWIRSPERLVERRGTSGEMAQAIASLGAGRLAVIASTGATVEELFLLKVLADATGALVGFLDRQGPRWESKSGFVIEEDRTPNRRGAERVFGELRPASELAAGVARGDFGGLLYVNALAGLPAPRELVDAAYRLQWIAVGDVLGNALVPLAHAVRPSAGWPEKHGVFVNRDGRIQRIAPLVPPPAGAEPEVVWLQELLLAMGVRKAAVSAEGVFREALPGMSYARIGALGTEDLALPQIPAGGPQSELR